MKSLPIYNPNIGTNQDIFEGIKTYLKRYKCDYNHNKKYSEQLYVELNELKTKIDNSFKEDIDTINNLQKELNAKQHKFNSLYNLLNTNDVKFMLDLINIFID